MRAWLWAILGVAFWALAAHVQQGSTPAAADAPAANFSALRAKAALTRVLGPELPRPTGSAQNAAVRARLLKELAALGVTATAAPQMSCYDQQRYFLILCGGITNIVADIVPGDGKAVVLMAHLDSVPAGPGAGDDGTGLATLLETIRALKAAPRAVRHPVIALFTDGEEYGMLGAQAFVQGPAGRSKVGVAINIDARGDAGQSLLFQTSPRDAALIDLYAQSVPHPATSSLYGEIYKFLPNDTDLTPFLRAGLTGYNFANVGNVAVYHTKLDSLAALDSRSLQSHGDNVLTLTRALAGSDFAALKSEGGIYLDVLGWWVPRLPVSWALPLSLLAFLIIALTGWLTRQGDIQRGGKRRALALLMPPALLLGAAATGYGLQWIAATMSGQPDPAFAQPLALRIALASGVFAVALLAARGATLASSWLWLAGFAVATAWFVPGASPYFLFPALIAMVTLPFASRWPRLAALPALAALILWIQLATNEEALLGLAQAMLFSLALATGAIACLPLLRPPRGALFALALALIAAVTAGYIPAYDAAHPQALNLLYVEDSGKASLIASPVARLPPALRAAADFSRTTQPGADRGYVAPAGTPIFAVPGAKVARQGGNVTIDLEGTGQGMMLLAVPKSAQLTSATVNGLTEPAPPGGLVRIYCTTPDCAHAHMVLHLASRTAQTILLMERRYGLPDKVAAIAKARPDYAVSNQFGDLTVLTARLAIPAS